MVAWRIHLVTDNSFVPAVTMFDDDGIDLSSPYTKYFPNFAGSTASRSGAIVYDPVDSTSMYVSAIGYFTNLTI